MYLVPSDRKLLATLKLVQGKPEDFLAIDFPNSDVFHSYNYTRSSIESAFHSERKVHIDMTEGELLSSLQYLCKHELLRKYYNGKTYQVTADGFRNTSVLKYEIVKTIVNNFLFPSLVAFVTTLITIFLTKN